MGVAISIFYGLFALVSTLNWLLMRRPAAQTGSGCLCVLIPARNESGNLAELLPLLFAQAATSTKIYVFDDESTDDTGDVAERLGAVVIRPKEPLPAGWTGKNRACHELAKAAMANETVDWLLFLDADVRPTQDFLGVVSKLATDVEPKVGVITGFPQILPGRGIEPIFLAWVGWILLATNPFGIVSRTRMGHNGFTNGQIHAWRADTYAKLWPNESVKGMLMEDVKMGRLCARHGVRVEVANLSQHLRVRMYETWRETVDGMSKNSFEIAGTYWGTGLVALFMALCGWGWLFAGSAWGIALALLTISGVMVAATCRSVVWPALLMPVVCLIGAGTIIRSAIWKATGNTTWKGRIYR